MEEIYTKDKPPSLEEQLADVQAHIEDLHVRTLLGYILHNLFWITHPISISSWVHYPKKSKKCLKNNLFT